MRKPWLWRPFDQEVARGNARAAATERARHRVEREEVEIFLEAREAWTDVHAITVPH